MSHQSINYVIAYTVWNILLCILSRLLDDKNQPCQRARTQKHICPVLPQAKATELRDSGFQSGSSSTGDGLALTHPHTVIQAPVDHALWICKDNHSRLGVGSEASVQTTGSHNDSSSQCLL